MGLIVVSKHLQTNKSTRSKQLYAFPFFLIFGYHNCMKMHILQSVV